jgi:hypothetical protein
MMIYRHFAYTTVDVTQTNVRIKADVDDWSLQRNQQRNLDTLIQTLGLRSQPVNIDVRVFEGHPAAHWLGKNLTEWSKIWEVQFDIEHHEAYGKDCELALKDINYVPIINGLTETQPSFPPVFQSSGTFKNIHIFFF